MKDIEVVLESVGKRRRWMWRTPFEDVKPLGLSYSYQDDGKLQKVCSYNKFGTSMYESWDEAVNGRYELYMTFHTNGLIKYRRGYNNYGVKDGLWISYNYDGSQSMYGRYKKGGRHGAWCVWKMGASYGYGRPRSCSITYVSHYRDGILHGRHAVYNPDGGLDVVCQFRDGIQIVGSTMYTDFGRTLHYRSEVDDDLFDSVIHDKYYKNLIYEIFEMGEPNRLGIPLLMNLGGG